MLYYNYFINPRRACAARVTILSLCVGVSVSTLILALQETKYLKSSANDVSRTSARKKCGDFAEATAFDIEKRPFRR